MPFAVISTMLLSEDHASNIKVENGKVMDIDGQKLVVGYACPGLTKSLKLTTYEPTEDIDIPEYVEVMADVTDFSLDFTATIISSGLLEDMDLKDLDDVDEMSINRKNWKKQPTNSLTARYTGRRYEKISDLSGSVPVRCDSARSGSGCAGERTAR